MRILIFLLFPLVGACQWSGIASNQTVSLNNLQNAVNTGVFTAKTSIPAGTKSITKAEANTYVNINTGVISYANKASNQLVAKQDLISASPATGVRFSGITGLYPLSGNALTSASGILTNYSATEYAYLYVVFNSAGLNSGSVSGDNMGRIPFPSVNLSGVITSYGQLLYQPGPVAGYRMNPGESFNISVSKNDGLGGGSTVQIYYSTTPCGFCSVPVGY